MIFADEDFFWGIPADTKIETVQFLLFAKVEQYFIPCMQNFTGCKDYVSDALMGVLEKHSPGTTVFQTRGQGGLPVLKKHISNIGSKLKNIPDLNDISFSKEELLPNIFLGALPYNEIAANIIMDILNYYENKYGWTETIVENRVVHSFLGERFKRGILFLTGDKKYTRTPHLSNYVAWIIRLATRVANNADVIKTLPKPCTLEYLQQITFMDPYDVDFLILRMWKRIELLYRHFDFLFTEDYNIPIEGYHSRLGIYALLTAKSGFSDLNKKMLELSKNI